MDIHLLAYSGDQVLAYGFQGFTSIIGIWIGIGMKMYLG